MYNLNPTSKRLEPQETKCAFCHDGQSTEMDDNCFVPLFREEDRTNVVVYRSVKFKKVPVGIPRCKDCKLIHEKSSTIAAFIGWGSGVLLVIMAFVFFGFLGIFSFFFGLMTGVFLTRFIENKLVRNKGIPTIKDATMENEAVQELVLNGWSLTQPMA
jgi:hypothetical protein